MMRNESFGRIGCPDILERRRRYRLRSGYSFEKYVVMAVIVFIFIIAVIACSPIM